MSRSICCEKGVSNTGLVGITETAAGPRRTPCFTVSWRERKHRRRSVNIYYGRNRSREVALALARTARARGLALREEWERKCAQRRRATP